MRFNETDKTLLSLERSWSKNPLTLKELMPHFPNVVEIEPSTRFVRIWFRGWLHWIFIENSLNLIWEL